MGFASFTCAKTHIPIMNFYSDGNPENYTIVLLSENEEPIQGEYDGYGNLVNRDGELHIFADVEDGKKKIVLKKFYGKEKFSDLKRNSPDPGQGHFYKPATLTFSHAASSEDL